VSIVSRLLALERDRGPRGPVTVISEEIKGEEPTLWQPIARSPHEFWPTLHSRAEFEAFCREHQVVWRRYIFERDHRWGAGS
jgi:hypothetical protein